MTRLVIAAAALLALPAVGIAKPAHKQALAAHAGPFLPKPLADCRLCHLDNMPADGDKPRNPFGERLQEVRKELREAGKPTDIAARFDAIADEDTDGDGVPNLVEVLIGHHPGDKADAPAKAEVAAAADTLKKYRAFLASYPWRPFEAVKRPPVPAVKDATWAKNPIDAFVAAEHAGRGLTPRPEVDRGTLLIRVTFDLTGLPPTPEELRAYVADTSADAYEKAVERLLASPRYGERWGRHWMDVWRYSDWAGWTGGNQIRDSQPHVWRWRDWIVESLNADKGYDRMVLELLAGDEVAPDDPATLRATGYLARNFKSNREKWMQDVVDHTFLAFQAVTVGCARCHDHFYDPIPQREYYQLRAVFEPHRVRIDRVPGERDTTKDGLARAYDADPAVATYLFVRGDERTPDKSAAVQPGAPSAYGPPFPGVKPVKLPPAAVSPDARDFVTRDELAAAAAAIATARAARDRVRATAGVLGFAAAPRAALAELDYGIAEAKRDSLRATVEADRTKTEGATKAAAAAQKHVAVLAARRAAMVAPPAKRKEAGAALATAEAAPEAYTPRAVATFPVESTGRRLALARWLTDPKNPLTARVAANHIWMRHFGRPLVPSVFDFGRNGRRPTHPALLDWLAAELAEHGWSMKHLHRLMVTSRTYRLASTPDAAGLAADADNLYLWRFAPRRLEAEAVRDRLLFVSGRLDLTTGGPEIDPARGFDVPRRSLYFRHAHERQMEFLKLFDAAGVTECYQRRESVVPQQALALANSPLAADAAKRLASALREKAADGAFATAAFDRILGRTPKPEELAECVAFLSDPGSAKDPARRRELLVLALLNHHEFVTVR